MQINKAWLLVLSVEEREAVQYFINRRLKLFDADALKHLQTLSDLSKQTVQRLQRSKNQFLRNNDRSDTLQAKLHDATLAEYQPWIKTLDRTIFRLQHATPFFAMPVTAF